MIRMKTLEDFNERMKNKFPEEHWEFIDIHFKSQEYSTLKCQDCGKIIRIQNCELFRPRHQYFCAACYSKGRQDSQKRRKMVEDYIKNNNIQIKDYFFFMKEQKNGIRAQALSFICNNCGNKNEKLLSNITRNDEVKIECSYCTGKKLLKNTTAFIQELEENYPHKFTVLSEYSSAQEKVRIKCNNCGFIRDVRAAQILRSGYCPKCDTKRSKGEKYISQWLEEHNIKYIEQKYFSCWDIGIHYFDFYLPELNLVLEYQGRQHYEYVEHFHKDYQDFLYRQTKDKQKKEAAIKNHLNYISIHYHNFDQLEEILTKLFSSTTIWKQSRGKCLEIQAIQDLDEDIVSTSSENQSSS